MPTRSDQLFDIRYWHDLWFRLAEAIVASGSKIIFVLLLYWISRKVAERLIDAGMARMVARQERISNREDHANRLRTLSGLVKSVVGYLLLFIMVVMLLDAVGANVSGLITTAGVGGLAFGFGAQKLVRDVISGFFLIIEDQFVVGDYVTIGAAVGVVEELGMRTTRIRDDFGRLWVLSNGDITIVVNHSRAPVGAYIEIGVAPHVDVHRVETLLNEEGEALASGADHVLLSPPKVQGVSAIEATRTVLRISISCDPRTLAAEQLRVRTALHDRLSREGIEMA